MNPEEIAVIALLRYLASIFAWLQSEIIILQMQDLQSTNTLH